MKLRALEPQDIDAIYAWENDSTIWQYSAAHIPFSRHFLTQYILSATSGDIYTDKQMRLIGDENNIAIGCVDLFDFDPYNHRAGIGILVDSQYRGKGFGKAMLQELISYCREDLQLHMLYAHVVDDNIASIHIFESVGFQRAGELKDWMYNAKDKKYKNALVLQFVL